MVINNLNLEIKNSITPEEAFLVEKLIKNENKIN
jgi:hypothetical protein